MCGMKTSYINKSQGHESYLTCLRCRSVTIHKVLVSFDTSENQDEYFENSAYQIIECQGCLEISFQKIYYDNGCYDYISDEVIPVISIYPIRSKDFWYAKEYQHLPKNLIGVYEEIIKCYNNNCLISCAGLIRALVEGICNANGVKDGPINIEYKNTKAPKRIKNLAGKINGLYEKGLITKAHSAAIHEHRLLGNEALHELTIQSKENLKIYIEIIEITLDNLYKMPYSVFLINNEKQSVF